MSTVRDITLAPEGEVKIAWAARNMPILRSIEADFAREKPLAGIKITLAVHVEAKTAYLCRVLAEGGAEMHITGCNPLSTQDDVAAALAAGGLDTHAFHACTDDEYMALIDNVLSVGPDVIIDDGGDLVARIHEKYPDLAANVIGSCEETTTGIHRLKRMASLGALRFPAVAVNDADCKHLFDNRYGTGQSVWDGIMRTTNLIVAGKDVVVAGYGWCGKGVSMRAKGLGARVIVTETDPVRALEAVMDGFRVMTMAEAAPIGDLFITVTGDCAVIPGELFPVMKDGAILANAGHFNVEIDVDALERMAVGKYRARRNIDGYRLPNGRTLFLLAEGRLVNLASGDGHPAEIMDMSFAIQALCAQYLAEHRGELAPGVVPVPREIDLAVARRKLASLGVNIDSLTDEQRDYIGVES